MPRVPELSAHEAKKVAWWGARVSSMTPIKSGAFSSDNWVVQTEYGRYVAKLYYGGSAAKLAAALRIANEIDGDGLSTGRAIPHLGGGLTATVQTPAGDRPFALLEYVGGSTLDLRATAAPKVLARFLRKVQDRLSHCRWR